MGLAGLNDRDNTNNETRSQDNNRLYGISRIKTETVIEQSGNVIHSGPDIFGYYYHKEPYPNEFYLEFYEHTAETYTFVNAEIPRYGEMERRIGEFEEVYIKKLYDVTARAYNLPEFPHQIYATDDIHRACLDRTVTKAVAIICDIMCSRGEAISNLPDDDKNLLLLEYYYRLDEYEKREESLIEELAEAKRSIAIWDEAIRTEGDPSPRIRGLVDELKEKIDKLENDLAAIKKEQDDYIKVNTSKINNIWRKIQFYNPR